MVYNARYNTYNSKKQKFSQKRKALRRKENMKKYIAVLLIIGLILGSILIYNMLQVEKNIYKTFSDSGYILQSKMDNQNEVERYYFSRRPKI